MVRSGVQFWVIDASVIGVANNIEHDQLSNAVEFLNRLLRLPVRIVLSDDIQAEYQRRFNESPKGPGTRWWRSMRRSSKLTYRSQRVPGRIRDGLRERGFHDDDYKYVAAALSVSTREANSPIVCIVQEDREDFGKIADLLSREGVRLATTEQAIEIIDSSN